MTHWNAGYPAVIITQLKKARRVLDARSAKLALRILDGRLGLRRCVHVLREVMARVRSRHNLRLSYGSSCSSSAATHLGATSSPLFCTSNNVRFSPV